MKTTIDFLKKATDFNILSEKTFNFNFNEYRGGSFKEIKPAKIFAYGVEWSVQLRWIDRGWGDYDYQYISEKDPKLPQKILIEKSFQYMPQWCKTTEDVRYFGKLIFSQSDDWGRKNLIWMSDFQEELSLCDSEKKVLQKIEEIQKR